MKCQLLSHVWLFADMGSQTVAHQASLSMEFSRQECWHGQPFLFPGDLPLPRERTQVSCIAGRFFTIWATREAPKMAIHFEIFLNELFSAITFSPNYRRVLYFFSSSVVSTIICRIKLSMDIQKSALTFLNYFHFICWQSSFTCYNFMIRKYWN